MGKIGILTFHYPENRNFGASLQTYAHQKLIEKLGKEVKIIDYVKERKEKSPIRYLFLYLEMKNFIEYNKKFLNLTRKYSRKSNLKPLNKEIDIFVVGSDQVWRRKYLSKVVKHYFFDFVDENKTKIEYAASFGIDYWEGDKELTEEIKELMLKFKYISVREESEIDICKKIFDISNVKCVLDPTLMIEKKDYNIILDDWKDKTHLEKKYIAHMLLDDTEEIREETKKISKYLNTEINYIKGKEKKFFKKYFEYNKVSQWLTYIKDSELVITDSFHCTVFSLIFHKKFIVVANKDRGLARLETLLRMVGLEERLFTDIKKVLKSGILNKKIDYVKVDKILNEKRKESFFFLKEALES